MSAEVDWSGFLIRAEQAQRRAEHLLATNRVRDGFEQLKVARDELGGAVVWLMENTDPKELQR